MRQKWIFIELLGGLLLWNALVLSTKATAAAPEDLLSLDTQSQEPITITSDKAELDNKEHTAVYRDNVTVKRGDVTLYSDEIKTWLDTESKRIKQIKASGRVKLEQADVVITATEAVYYDKEQKIVLTGKPLCKKGDNVLTGSSITYYIYSGKIMVEDAKSTLKPKPDIKTENQRTEP